MFFTQCIHPNEKCGEQRNVKGTTVCAIALRPSNKKGATTIPNCIIQSQFKATDIQKEFESIETTYKDVYSESIDIDSYSLSKAINKLDKAITNVRKLIDKL